MIEIDDGIVIAPKLVGVRSPWSWGTAPGDYYVVWDSPTDGGLTETVIGDNQIGGMERATYPFWQAQAQPTNRALTLEMMQQYFNQLTEQLNHPNPLMQYMEGQRAEGGMNDGRMQAEERRRQNQQAIEEDIPFLD